MIQVNAKAKLEKNARRAKTSEECFVESKIWSRRFGIRFFSSIGRRLAEKSLGKFTTRFLCIHKIIWRGGSWRGALRGARRHPRYARTTIPLPFAWIRCRLEILTKIALKTRLRFRLGAFFEARPSTNLSPHSPIHCWSFSFIPWSSALSLLNAYDAQKVLTLLRKSLPSLP